ncbi:MAG: 30S ribosomal protein S3ae [Candidatus Bathyarchaeota archaeon]|nr:MAG: 30S ribosomal protein S3ae [Candidatus Bathyarchaeota archaeon]
MKKWYNLYSPTYFGTTFLGSAPCNDPSRMMGRIVETTLYDITGDFSQQHIKLYFQVVDLKGNDAYTIFKGHEYSRDYLRSLVRRGSTRVDRILNLATKDGYRLRVSVTALSIIRIKTTQVSLIRALIQTILNEKAMKLEFSQFVQEAVLGKIASDIYNESKKICPLRHVGLRKSKLLASPPSKPAEDIEVEVTVEA